LRIQPQKKPTVIAIATRFDVVIPTLGWNSVAAYPKNTAVRAATIDVDSDMLIA
jgi:hypothetical protein